MKIVILAGGPGTKLWPMVTDKIPKQFLTWKFFNNRSLFQLTYERLHKFIKERDIMILCPDEYKIIATKQIGDLGIKLTIDNFIIEPGSKGTLWATVLAIKKLNREDFICIVPADQYWEDNHFKLMFNTIKNKAKKINSIALLGIKPQNPSDQYGYFKIKKGKISSFLEKPNREMAKKYIREGYLWNSGILFINCEGLTEQLDRIGIKLDYDRYLELEKAQFDKLILEKINNLVGFVYNKSWYDLGTFKSLYRFLDDFKEKFRKVIFYDELGNIFFSSEYMPYIKESTNNLIIIESKKESYFRGIHDCAVIIKNNNIKVESIV